MYHHDEVPYTQQPVHGPPAADYPSSGDRYAASNTLGAPPALYPSHNYPHPFTRAGEGSIRSLEPPTYQNVSPLTNFPHPNQDPQYFHGQHESWALNQGPHSAPLPGTSPLPYVLPSPSPFPPPGLAPPSRPLQKVGTTGSRPTLAGSLDPSTGIFYRTPEHPRLRTAQACEKCRTRKAKCSGEHPSCNRCLTRGLPCEYAKEGRVRGPNKSRAKNVLQESNEAQGFRNISRARTSSPTSLHHLPPNVRQALAVADSKVVASINGQRDHGPTRSNAPPIPGNRVMRSRPQELQLGGMSYYYPDHSSNHLHANLVGPRSDPLPGGGLFPHYDLRGHHVGAQMRPEGRDPSPYFGQNGKHIIDTRSVNFLPTQSEYYDARNPMYPEPQLFGTSSDNDAELSSANVNQGANCGSPLTCESGTTSSTGSPLTPASSASTNAALSGRVYSSRVDFVPQKLNESNSLEAVDLHAPRPITIDPSLMSSDSPQTCLTPEQGHISGDHSPLHSQGTATPYQAMDVQMC